MIRINKTTADAAVTGMACAISTRPQGSYARKITTNLILRYASANISIRSGSFCLSNKGAGLSAPAALDRVSIGVVAGTRASFRELSVESALQAHRFLHQGKIHCRRDRYDSQGAFGSPLGKGPVCGHPLKYK